MAKRGPKLKPENEINIFSLYYRQYRARKTAGKTQVREIDKELTKDILMSHGVNLEPVCDEIGWKVFRNDKQMKLHKNAQGYYYVSYAINKKPYAIGLHRLVYCMCNGDIPKGYCVDHIDHNIYNNDPRNLRILTRSENSKNQY